MVPPQHAAGRPETDANPRNNDEDGDAPTLNTSPARGEGGGRERGFHAEAPAHTKRDGTNEQGTPPVTKSRTVPVIRECECRLEPLCVCAYVAVRGKWAQASCVSGGSLVSTQLLLTP